MLVEIPVLFYYEEGGQVDYESLGINPPDIDKAELKKANVYLNPDIVNYIEPKIGEDGCYLNIGENINWASTLSAKEASKRINEAISK